MKIELKKLTLQYFKGAKDLTIDLGHRTSIKGANATGKTRLFDLFTWILFGKDSEDRKDFNIKCLDANNQPIHRVDTHGVAVLSVDGMDTKFERIYKEKWVKKRGEETAEFAGHETLFFVNGVPLQLKDYTEKVESILPESLFKQVTNPAFFNSMKWTDRRAMLFQMAGNVTDQDVIATNKDLKKFYEAIIGKSFDEYKRELAAKKKLLKESILNIPARIDEVSRTIVPDPDYSQIQIDIDKHNARIFKIDGLIASDAEKFNTANQENQRKQNRIYEIQRQIKDLQFEDQAKAEKDVNELKIKKSRLFSEIQQLKSEIAGYNDRLKERKSAKETIEKDNDDLRNKWTEINSLVFTTNANEFICGQCNRPFETEDIDAKKAEMLTSFNNSKTVRLENITKAGKGNASHIEELNKEITKFHESIEGAGFKLVSKQSEYDSIIIPDYPPIEPNPQIKVLQDELTMTNSLMKAIAKTDNSILIQEKSEINNALDTLKKALTVKEQNEKLTVRKQELIDSEKSLSQQIADLEKQEFQCEAFTRAKIGMIEDKVNSMFSLVKIKLFNGLVNGGSEEVCTTLINGVPYEDANAAARVQGGLDIIRTLSKHYDVFAPVIIDNRESVTEIPEMDCQVISLYVDPDCKELKVINN
jgi:DNA repair protein SbcC/Rad50